MLFEANPDAIKIMTSSRKTKHFIIFMATLII